MGIAGDYDGDLFCCHLHLDSCRGPTILRTCHTEKSTAGSLTLLEDSQ